MITVLELVRQTAAALGLPLPNSIEEELDSNAARVCASLQLAAEEISVQYNWLALRRAGTFITGSDNPAWSEVMNGYSLERLTQDVEGDIIYSNSTFDRFSTNYLYDITQRQIIPEVTTDRVLKDKTYSPGSQSLSEFFRIQHFLCFFPNLPAGDTITFTYQGNYVAQRMVNGFLHSIPVFEKNDDFVVLPAPLLKRGGVVQYNMTRGFDNDKQVLDYNNYLKYCKDAQAPAGVQVPKGYAVWR
jgi:hypothetical protein